MKPNKKKNELNLKLNSKKLKSSDIDNYLFDFKTHISKKVRYLEVSASFDTESTSFYQNIKTGEIISVPDAKKIPRKTLDKNYRKGAITYAWVFVIHGNAFLGRDINEFVSCMKKISDHYELGNEKRLIVYVHNLAFDWQFIKHYFKWTSVFSTKPRNPIKAVTDIGIEFRDSLILSGYSLAKTGENLHKYKVEKMVGDLDYSLLRHTGTPLTEKEEGYIINDGLVVCAFIQEQIEACGSITRIPLTKTGFVRKYLRQACYFTKSSHKRDVDKKFAKYRQLMERLQIGSLEEYLLVHQCYTGAIVHANCFRSNKIIEDVYSMDFTSSYPAVMVLSANFPMSRGRKVKIKSREEFDNYMKNYCCLVDAEFFDIEKSNQYESIISVSKCVEKENAEEDNGRLISASRIRLVFNDVDYKIYQRFYKWKKLRIHRFYIYEKGRLPTDFVNAVLDLYEKKTTLKGVEGKEREYLRSKEDVNSAYGCSVTDVCRNENAYDPDTDKWEIIKKDFWEQIDRYNKSKSRFMLYHWGVWVTSAARLNLSSGIMNLANSNLGKGGSDYIYSDTDSVKFTNYELHKDYFERYNRYIDRQIEKAAAFHKIPISKFKPKTQEGEIKVIGYWDKDKPFHYKRFKTLGAKRYAYEYEKDGKIVHSLTIAGVNKKTAVPYVEKHEKDFFDCMKFGYVFNAEACGKNLHTYIDTESRGVMVDYLGNAKEVYSPSCVHLEPTTYEMSTTDDYKRVLDGIIEMFLGY